MSLTNLPFGFIPTYHPSGQIRPIAHEGLILSGQTGAILSGMPVTILIGSGGTINGVTVATGQIVLAPVTANNTDVLGVFAGCEYVDATGKPTESNQWISGQTILAGTTVRAFVYEDPEIIYEVQADAAVSVGTLGQIDFKQVNTSNFAAGSTVTGLSQATVTGAPVATSSQGQWYLRKFSPSVLNTAFNDAFPIVQVSLARSILRANKVSV